MLTDFFDTMGTVTGVAAEAGPRQRGRHRCPASAASCSSTPSRRSAGGVGGISSNTTYIESAAGVAEGGRTGFASVVTGVLFLLAVFLAPIAGIVPARATAPALVLVGYLMFTLVKDIPVADFEDGLPALLTMILMPLTYDITVGIGAGFISWVLIKVVQGKVAEVHPLMWLVSLAFVVFFLQDWIHASCPSSGRLTGPHRRRPGQSGRRAVLVPVPSGGCSNGPRCPTGRASSAPALPGARSVSDRGVRPRRLPPREPTARPASPTSWSTSPSRARPRYPTTRAISEAIEGVGGSFNAATDRESTVYWVRVPRREARARDGRPRRADRPADARRATRSTSERTVIIEEIRSYLDDPSEYCQILFQQRCSATARWAARSAATRPGSAPCPARAIHDFWAHDVPAGEHGGRGRGRPRARRGGRARRRAAFGTGNGAVPGSSRRRRCRPASGSLDRPPRHGAGAARDRRPGAPARPPRQRGRSRSSTRSSATG